MRPSTPLSDSARTATFARVEREIPRTVTERRSIWRTILRPSDRATVTTWRSLRGAFLKLTRSAFFRRVERSRVATPGLRAPGAR